MTLSHHGFLRPLRRRGAAAQGRGVIRAQDRPNGTRGGAGRCSDLLEPRLRQGVHPSSVQDCAGRRPGSARVAGQAREEQGRQDLEGGQSRGGPGSRHRLDGEYIRGNLCKASKSLENH